MTTRLDDIDDIETLIQQAYPCLKTGNFRPNHAIVITFSCMLHFPDDKEACINVLA